MAEYSFVIPIYRDGDLAGACCETIRDDMRTFLGRQDVEADIEVIFVNDGSPDRSQQALEAVARQYPFVRVVELSRNFGRHVAISRGYQFASEPLCRHVRRDMQDPPDQLPG